ncbi:hypothetical protein CSKR_105430 [Clonorchis sinensis]|uniref:Uncharacterized protein n=1 Tax=Clonorchis sinensis TaxID=79923 RepID=A0A419Q0L3_CLOSI|nr:hypothetical protein CSKR_105430 [Clonorchis sinensis]
MGAPWCDVTGRHCMQNVPGHEVFIPPACCQICKLAVQAVTTAVGQAQNHRRWAMHPCYWRGDGYTNAPWCNVTERPSLQGVPVHHTRFSSLVHATRSARWKTNQAVINAVCALKNTPATNFFLVWGKQGQ